MKLVTGAVTDVGQVREGNEDGYLVVGEMGLVAVADGMGGHRAGEVASATALEALRAAVENGEAIRDAVSAANAAVVERATGQEDLRGMGTTMTAGTLAAGGTLLIGHVGDSRAYLARDGGFEQITEDHSLVEELVRGGELTPEQAEVHPQRSIITRALGIEPEVDVDLYPVQLQDGDRLVLCSDGLTTMVRADDIAAILAREPAAEKAARALVDAANAAGGEDNVTVIVVNVVADGDEPATAAAIAPGVADRAADTDTAVPAAGAPPAAVQDRPPPRRRRRALTRVLLWAIPIVLVLGIAVGALGWYARRTYYVDVGQGKVTLYQGVPGGLLGWDPTVEARSHIDAADLTRAERTDLDGGKRFSSRGSAEDYIADLGRDVDRREKPTTTTTTRTTTTTPPTTNASTPPAPL